MTNKLRSEKLEIERIIFIGRTYKEYLKMFDLSLPELERKNILDCPAGACSFSAIGRQKGLNIEACDIAYYFNRVDLYAKGKEDIQHTIEKMKNSEDNYNWNYFKNIEDLKYQRQQALEDCVEDMKRHNNQYKAVSLPELPYFDEAFDIVLSAHFLFMYADRLDYAFHIKCLEELLRVSKKELRIFPLVDLEGHRYAYLDHIIKNLTELGYNISECKVDYEFQTHANTMLKIVK
ncbi:SAM-dependent methyltransferase [Staphylococcus succinus]|uniref:SAM-dependent methyltransferase n=1 Tax=Staphylococcus succinus TaxID=61015 RepID=UPI000E6A7EF5|nr:SAM-dependent methyltransferase [Staphylococcus succinus]RIN26345.1 SAM-dependent methyltransferase [Staphylococcus succinus]RIN43976.1 SAM-dependent methyltransferase [Staphylococcus succinus]